jgi:hypothetical protein
MHSLHLRRALGGVLLLATGACGDDTVVYLPDGGGPDATTAEASPGDDGSDGACTPYDARGLDEAAVQAGADLVTSLKCRKCHGDVLSGNPDGVKSPQTEGGLAYPPNLTPDPTTGLGCWTNAEIANAFLHGIDNQGQPLCPPMPLFADAGIDASAAADIVAYLRSLPAESMNIPGTPSCTLGPTGDDGGGTGDAGPGDAGLGPSDAGPSDAGPSDAGSGDAGPSDAGPSDAGPSDASAADAGADASPDSGDAGAE